MPTLVVYQLNTDPFFSNNVDVVAAFTVDVVDDDTVLEDPDGGVQIDVSGIPGFVGDSSNFQAFETYSGFVAGDPVTFTLLQFAGNEYMVLTEGSVSVGDTITGTGFGTSLAPPVDYSDLPDFVCFTRGSRIQTPDGPKRVERLVPGELVVVAGGEAKPVKWVGKRFVGARELCRKKHLRPVLIRRHAFGTNFPSSEMRVSQQHRIALSSEMNEIFFLTENVLVPARFLVDDQTVLIDEDVSEIEYIHLLFDKHELVNVEGIWSESFFLGDTTVGALSKNTRVELLELFPELAEDPSSYGKTSMTVLKPHEVAVVRAQLRAFRPPNSC